MVSNIQNFLPKLSKMTPIFEKTADELLEKGTYNTLVDSLTTYPDAALAYKMAIGLNK